MELDERGYGKGHFFDACLCFFVRGRVEFKEIDNRCEA